MKILIISDSFKNSISSEKVNKAILRGFKEIFPNDYYTLQAISDGGEGALSIFENNPDFNKINCKSVDAFSKEINSFYLIKNNKAYFELAQTSGINNIKKDNLNIERSTTYGLGLQIKDALLKKIDSLTIFLGGSSGNDAGLGVLQALDFSFLDVNNNLILEHITGKHLNIIKKIIPPKKTLTSLYNTNIIIAADVTNPFTGEQGAVKTYAKQKGASLTQIKNLEKGMININNIIKKKKQINLSKIKSSGSAGGTAGGLYAYTNAKIISGFDVISKEINLKEKIKNTDIIITGEGSVDKQSNKGKVIKKIEILSKKYQKKMIALTGNIKTEYDSIIIPIQNRPMSITESIQNSEQLIYLTAKRIAKLIKLGRNL